MNIWVITFPCLMYLGSLGRRLGSLIKPRANVVNVAMGIAVVYQNSHTAGVAAWSSFPYFSITLSLNILLTLMISVRVILHARNTRNALGIAGIGGLCKTIVTMLVESCALYAVSSLLVIIPLGAGNLITNFFLFILPETQVRALPEL